MLAVLSPAKRLREGPAVDALPHTTPELLDQSQKLVNKARRLSKKKLRDLMGISDDLATLNKERFDAWTPAFTSDNARQAALSFAGDTYTGFDAPSLSPDDLAWAQGHVAILSGLYGVLRPLDSMQPYRLEMGTKLPVGRAKDLYAFWRPKLAGEIDAALHGHEERVIVNLASVEYFKALDTDAIDARVITPVFQDVKDGKPRVLFLFAKQARGAMARFIVQHRLTQAEQLKAFDGMGYRYVDALSEGDRWVFQREQPPPVGR